MMVTKFNGVAVGASALMVLLPFALGAQASECKINDGSPYQVNGAKQYVITAANSRKEDEIPKHLANAIRVLTDSPEKINNELGRQYMLARTYAQWLKRSGAEYVMKRGALGFSTDKDRDQNLLLALDSAVTAVERLMPACKSTVRPYRDQFGNEIYNKAVAAMNADHTDSSVYYSKLALQLASADPRPWNVLAAVYQKQGKPDSAMIAMEKVIDLAGADTAYKRVKQQSRYNLAVMKLQLADQGKGAGKDDDIKRARALLEAYLKDAPGEPAATQALGRAMRLSGDTAAVASVFAEILKDPGKYTADQLFEAASNAAAAGRDKDAVTMFENGLTKNPNHRLALLNLSNVLYQMKDAERMSTVTPRLIQVSPNSSESWQMHAGYWQLRQRAEEDPAKKKAYGDSTVAAIKSRDGVNPKIAIFLASKSGNSYQVQGNLSNESDKAASYTIKFELLDETGAVAATKEVAVGPVDAGASAAFSLKVEGAKIVAYRYLPVK
jgi:tetratricopeptide (TPR) repeat protein